ncbi:MAG: hypothetical protein Q9169_006747 [Polycauliona sp. 2 TL-2023]
MSSSGHVIDEEDDEVSLATILNRMREINASGYFGAKGVSHGADSDHRECVSGVEEDDVVESTLQEEPEATNGPNLADNDTNDLTASATGRCEDATAPQAEDKPQLIVVHRDPASYPDNSPFQPGLGSLSILPPEIRSQIWELVIPTTNFRLNLKPEQKPVEDPIN